MKLSRPARQPSHRGWIPGQHRGMDFGWGGGSGIYAAAPGVVESVYGDGGWNGGWGNRIALRHTPRAVTTYSHWENGSGLVSPGQSVGNLQDLAEMGETGDTDGKHLHFELYIDGVRVDPASYFEQDLPGSDGAGVGVPAPSGWSVGETDFTGSYGLNELNGARWYVIEPTTDNGKTIWAIAQQHGVDLASVRAWTGRVAASKWAGQLLQAGSSWWDGSDRYYAGVCIALNDVAGILDAVEAQAVAAQLAAVLASQKPAAQPELDGSAEVNSEIPDASRSAEIEVSPRRAARAAATAKEPAASPRAVAIAPSLEEIASAVGQIKEISQQWESDPDRPPIGDKVALPLWLILGTISVSATPALLIPTLDWANYTPLVAQQAAALIVAWAGGMASLLGLSRFARTTKSS